MGSPFLYTGGGGALTPDYRIDFTQFTATFDGVGDPSTLAGATVLGTSGVSSRNIICGATGLRAAAGTGNPYIDLLPTDLFTMDASKVFMFGMEFSQSAVDCYVSVGEDSSNRATLERLEISSQIAAASTEAASSLFTFSSASTVIGLAYLVLGHGGVPFVSTTAPGQSSPFTWDEKAYNIRDNRNAMTGDIDLLRIGFKSDDGALEAINFWALGE